MGRHLRLPSVVGRGWRRFSGAARGLASSPAFMDVMVAVVVVVVVAAEGMLVVMTGDVDAGTSVAAE